jgi:hypothetical protein
LAFEAIQVAAVRKIINDGIRTANAAIPIATVLESVPRYGKAMSLTYQIAVAADTMSPATTGIGDLVNVSTENAAHVNAAAGLYGAIAADDGASPSGGGGQLKVVTADLKQVSEIQNQIGSKIEAASQTTSGTAANVLKTHGTACASMSAALSQAVAARNAAATSMRIRSQRLSDGLQTAVTKYDATDRQGGEKIGGSLRPS